MGAAVYSMAVGLGEITKFHEISQNGTMALLMKSVNLWQVVSQGIKELCCTSSFQ